VGPEDGFCLEAVGLEQVILPRRILYSTHPRPIQKMIPLPLPLPPPTLLHHYLLLLPRHHIPRRIQLHRVAILISRADGAVVKMVNFRRLRRAHLRGHEVV